MNAAATDQTSATQTIKSCSCGKPEIHEIARRHSADGKVVCLGSCGAVTGMMAFAAYGIPLARPRTEEGHARAIDTGWMFLGDVMLYESSELATFYAACKWAISKGLGISAARGRFAEPASLRPFWEVVSANRDGQATLRVWRLPRIAWPGLAVWDHCGSAGSGGSGGRYELWTIDRDGVCETTGFSFANMRQLAEHLFATRE